MDVNNIRALGRHEVHGILNINFIASMDQLASVEENISSVMSISTFTAGNRYSDYVPGQDPVADVSIGGLIGGDMLLNAGLVAVALIFLKKFGFLAIIPIFAAWRMFSS